MSAWPVATGKIARFRSQDALWADFFRLRIAATDRQIDLLVYELYGLTAEEIRIVEEAT